VTARAQANLLGFAAAVVVVVTVTIAGAALASDALADADRQPAATYAAERLSTHLVAADAAHTRGANTLRADRIANLTLADLDREVPPIRDRPVSVTIGDETIVERGAVDGDTIGEDAPRPTNSVRVERRVRIERDVERTERIDLTERAGRTLPDHTGRVVVRIDTRRTRTVHTLRADGRVVLHDAAGLSGRYIVRVPDVRPLDVDIGSDGDGPGTVTLSWTATNDSVEQLVVSVGA
jgi:hypothetical protein